MKRLGSSDSLGAYMSICPSTDEHSPGNNHVYDMEFQSMYEGLDDEGNCIGEPGHIAQKKRRLSVSQVKALEKNFEVENKLEPERKVKLAQELGLQPRQVAVWFQNRRARWKTKNLERDYGILKASFDALKHNYDTLQHGNEALLKELRELKSKLNEEKSESNVSMKEEIIAISESDNKVIEQSKPPPPNASPFESDSIDMNFETFKNTSNGLFGSSVLPDLKDGSSDSDSSAILNEEIDPEFKIFNCTTSSSSLSQSKINWFQFSESKSNLGETQKQKAAYQPQFVKIEEHNFLGGDESCNFFTEEQAPTLQWYCPDQWN